MRISPTSNARRRLTAGVATGVLLLAACGGSGGGDASDAPAGDTLPEAPATDVPDEAPQPVDLAAGMVDLVGPEVQPSADYDGNQLPDVVVDELGTGRKVNFRNLVPQDKPILLWMWAPH